jgi:hypothetical protein
MSNNQIREKDSIPWNQITKINNGQTEGTAECIQHLYICHYIVFSNYQPRRVREFRATIVNKTILLSRQLTTADHFKIAALFINGFTCIA